MQKKSKINFKDSVDQQLINTIVAEATVYLKMYSNSVTKQFILKIILFQEMVITCLLCSLAVCSTSNIAYDT